MVQRKLSGMLHANQHNMFWKEVERPCVTLRRFAGSFTDITQDYNEFSNNKLKRRLMTLTYTHNNMHGNLTYKCKNNKTISFNFTSPILSLK